MFHKSKSDLRVDFTRLRRIGGNSPISPRTIFLSSVAILSQRIHEWILIPDAVCFGETGTAYFIRRGFLDVTKATMKSFEDGFFFDRITDGRIFWADKSVNGNGTKTIFHFSNIRFDDVARCVNIRFVFEKIKSAAVLVHICQRVHLLICMFRKSNE